MVSLECQGNLPKQDTNIFLKERSENGKNPKNSPTMLCFGSKKDLITIVRNRRLKLTEAWVKYPDRGMFYIVSLSYFGSSAPKLGVTLYPGFHRHNLLSLLAKAIFGVSKHAPGPGKHCESQVRHLLRDVHFVVPPLALQDTPAEIVDMPAQSLLEGRIQEAVCESYFGRATMRV